MVKQGGDVLEATMREFGVDARLIDATVGPTVTRYELELAAGVKVSKVTSLSKEIAYAMASHDVRILARIRSQRDRRRGPEQDAPDRHARRHPSSPEAKKANHPLEVSMGRDIAGRAVFANLATFPHVLIAGQTGGASRAASTASSRRSSCARLPTRYGSILIDPKRVEM